MDFALGWSITEFYLDDRFIGDGIYFVSDIISNSNINRDGIEQIAWRRADLGNAVTSRSQCFRKRERTALIGNKCCYPDRIR